MEDGLAELAQGDDAAAAFYGNDWQMPSMWQFRELVNDEYTTTKRTMQNDVYGMLITSKKNGNSIFLPAAGIRMETELYNDGSRAYYWSRELNTSSNDKACDFNFDTRNSSLTDSQARCYGLSIRPVNETIVPDNHDYVDLGLTSGTLWATCNIGAKNPADYGDYFAWGETEPKSEYTADNYLFYNNGSSLSINKYCINQNFGLVDGKTVLEPGDDVATAVWGKNWEMPTIEQVEELLNPRFTTWTWTSKTRSDGLLNRGILITSKVNGNSIFLPAGGYIRNTEIEGEDWNCYYWTRSLGLQYLGNANAYCFGTHNDYHPEGSEYNVFANDGVRYLGQSIRPVRKK